MPTILQHVAEQINTAESLGVEAIKRFHHGDGDGAIHDLLVSYGFIVGMAGLLEALPATEYRAIRQLLPRIEAVRRDTVLAMRSMGEVLRPPFLIGLNPTKKPRRGRRAKR